MSITFRWQISLVCDLIVFNFKDWNTRDRQEEIVVSENVGVKNLASVRPIFKIFWGSQEHIKNCIFLQHSIVV